MPDNISFVQFRPFLEDVDSTRVAVLLSENRKTAVRFFFQGKVNDSTVLDIEVQPNFQRNLDAFRARLSHLNEENYKVFLCADSGIQLDRLGVLFEDYLFETVRFSLIAESISYLVKVEVARIYLLSPKSVPIQKTPFSSSYIDRIMLLLRLCFSFILCLILCSNALIHLILDDTQQISLGDICLFLIIDTITSQILFNNSFQVEDSSKK